jgi:thioredoxin reductase
VAAAVQLARHGIAPLVFERAEPGGLLRTAWLVENLPGFPGGLPGPELADLLARQLRASGAEVVGSEVVSLGLAEGVLACGTDSGDFLFRAVIVASGTRPRPVTGVDIAPDASEWIFREVGELWGVEGKSIAIVGGGDAAFDYAQGLCNENDVTIVMRGARARCLPLLEERARSCGRVTLRTRTRVASVSVAEGGGLLLAAEVDGPGGAREELASDYLVLAMGREPNDWFLSQELRRSEEELCARGELVFAGDVRSGIFRQASIAAGQGTQAAMKVARMLSDRSEAGATQKANGGVR